MLNKNSVNAVLSVSLTQHVKVKSNSQVLGTIKKDSFIKAVFFFDSDSEPRLLTFDF